MKTLVVLLLLALLFSAGLTFLLFADRPEEIDPIREQYASVFARFGVLAEDAYRQYDDAYGLDILQSYDIEGLRILKRYGHLVSILQPYVDAETLVLICRDHGDQLGELLDQFQPAVIAGIQNRFGSDGLEYVLEKPERYFLLRTYGDTLVQLANAKGPIVFDLVKVYQPEFIELYYDDALFKTINRFGVDGLIAVKTYRGMATAVFDLFADDERFETILRTYGYQQVIPVLYYFYQMKEPTPTITERLSRFELHTLFQTEDETSAAPSPRISDALTKAHVQFDRASWALEQIYTQGNTFLRQFDISDTGTVTPLPVVSIANLFEEFFFAGLRRRPVPADPGSPSGSPDAATSDKTISCEQLALALDILGLLPPETIFSKQARCGYLRAAIASATSLEGIEGLIALDEQQDIVTLYGTSVIPFITQYGREGLQLVRETDGEIVRFALVYGQDLVQFTIKYGPDVLELVNEFGSQMMEAIRETNGTVIPYTKIYGKDIFRLLEHPEGKAFLSLAPVFGDTLLQYVIQYPQDFPEYLLKYGRLSVKALDQYDGAVVTHAQKYGDDVVYYAGKYGDDALPLINTGNAGMALLRVMPEPLLEKNDRQILRKSLLQLCLSLLFTSPRTLHAYIGELSETTFSIAPTYGQLAFWTLLFWLMLYLLYLLYAILKRIF